MAELSQSQSKTLFSDFTESRRGEFCDSQSSTDTYVPSEGQVLLRRCQSEVVCLACFFCVQCCEATPSVPLRVTAGVFGKPPSPSLRRRWQSQPGWAAQCWSQICCHQNRSIITSPISTSSRESPNGL